jgi:hypothetical protein
MLCLPRCVLLAGGQIKSHKRGQAHYTVGVGSYPHKYTTLPITRKSKGRGRSTSEAATSRRDHSEKRFPVEQPPLSSTQKGGPNWKRKWRLLVDFRKLNEKTVGDAYPLPDITEILDQLGQYKYFSCLDMVMGYHQIELTPGRDQKLPLTPSRATGSTEDYPLG